MSKGNPIPTQARVKVKERDHGRCVRCSLPARPGNYHHRRGRRVKDEHQHCKCNLVLMCPECHAYVHRNPEDARKWGWIVQRHRLPFEVPVYVHRQWTNLGCG